MGDIYCGALVSSDYLEHFGIKGMRWGVRRYENKDGTLTSAGKRRYSSTGLQSYVARRRNEKVDKSFKKWKENSDRKANAVELGKKANLSRMAYEQNRSDKAAKAQYKSDTKAYKKALKSNTTYRKGQIRGEVGQDISRKYLSEAKRVSKQLDANPNDRRLQKEYNRLMSKHDVERERARRAPAVGAARSRRIATLKRGMTIAIKSAAASAALSAGLYAAKKYGKINVSSDKAGRAIDLAKRIMRAAMYVY